MASLNYGQRFSLILLSLSILWRVLLNSTTSNPEKLLSSTTDTSRILLLTAHPDDECLFFAPTILSILKSQKAEVYSLCLSVGDGDGFGPVRKGELQDSLDVLGVDEEKRWIVDSPDLRDNITLHWDADVIASAIKPYVLNNRIDTILTFDKQGVSLHPNHASLPGGVANLISSVKADSAQAPPKLFTLVTVPVLQKYIGPFAPLLAKFDIGTVTLFRRFSIIPQDGPGELGTGYLPVFVSGVRGYKTALQAMMKHQSQLMWFRWLYVSFSRYMWVNEWVEYQPVA